MHSYINLNATKLKNSVNTEVSLSENKIEGYLGEVYKTTHSLIGLSGNEVWVKAHGAKNTRSSTIHCSDTWTNDKHGPITRYVPILREQPQLILGNGFVELIYNEAILGTSAVPAVMINDSLLDSGMLTVRSVWDHIMDRPEYSSNQFKSVKYEDIKMSGMMMSRFIDGTYMSSNGVGLGINHIAMIRWLVSRYPVERWETLLEDDLACDPKKFFQKGSRSLLKRFDVKNILPADLVMLVKLAVRTYWRISYLASMKTKLAVA